MKKGFYHFGECGSLSRGLVIAGCLSFLLAVLFFCIGGRIELTRPNAVGETTYSIGCAFFLLLSLVLFIANHCVHKICTDIATLLKQLEAKK